LKEIADRVDAASDYILSRTHHRPRVGLVLGSGLGNLADELGQADVVKYADIPNFPILTVPGHSGDLVIGELAGWETAVLRGRPHFYDGYSMDEVVFPIRVLRRIGCEVLIVTNAAGGLNPTFSPGDLMVIVDHINLPGLAGLNPLVGRGHEGSGERFVGMAGAYDPKLAEIAAAAGEELGIPLRKGVYAMVSGPNYETHAELRLLRAVGADAVGMSTAPEVVVARQNGMRVLGISCITNLATGLDPARAANGPADGGELHVKLTHAEVLARGEATLPALAALISSVLRRLARDREAIGG
jgi:purine-nucleoside phosphorylase